MAETQLVSLATAQQIGGPVIPPSTPSVNLDFIGGFRVIQLLGEGGMGRAFVVEK